MSPKPAGSKWNGDHQAAQRLALAKKAAERDAVKLGSWWTRHAAPGSDRAAFNADLDTRHRQILNSASSSTRSLHRVI